MSEGSGAASTAANLSIVSPMTEREKFLAILPNGPVLPPDAIIVLLGEDAEPRLSTAVGRFFELSRYIEVRKLEDYKLMLVLSGGIHDPPRRIGAKEAFKRALTLGVAHDCVLLDSDSQNTRQQAVQCVDLAHEKGWRRLMLVASPYHMPRAFLTFLKALQERDMDKALQLVPMASDHTPWWDSPDGVGDDRIGLFVGEMLKCHNYTDHVATWADGLAYLEYWGNGGQQGGDMTLSELRAEHPDLFYEQNWFDGEEFMEADVPYPMIEMPSGVASEGDYLATAAALAGLYVRNPMSAIWKHCLWTCDKDSLGQRVYVTDNGKGLEIHRHLHLTDRFGVPTW